MSEPSRIELVEDRIPLEGLPETAAELIEMYGGRIDSRTDGQMSFTLPVRRGIAAAGEIDCRMSWTASEGNEGQVTLSVSHVSDRPRPQQNAILVAGVIGATLWMLWPFIPGLGAASWVGAVIAFAAYFLTLKRTSGGIANDLLQRLARIQRERVPGPQAPVSGP